MLYAKSLVVPPGRPADNPVEEIVRLTHGVITRIDCDFPLGCNNYVSAYVRRGLHQVWPNNPDGRARATGLTVSSAEYLEIFFEPLEVVVGGYAPASTYQHELTFRIELTPSHIAERGSKLDRYLAGLARLLGVR